MSRFLALIYDDEQKWIDWAEGADGAMAAHRTFNEKHASRILAGEGLEPTTTATSVRDGAVTDGPFVETKEALGGFYLLEADDLDAAVELAREIPAPFGGGVEVRPVLEFS